MSLLVQAAGYSAAIAHEQHCVARSGGSQRLAQVGDRRGELALSLLVPAARCGAALALSSTAWRGAAAACA